MLPVLRRTSLHCLQPRVACLRLGAWQLPGARQARGIVEVIATAGAESDTGGRTGRVRSFGHHHSGLDLKLEKIPAKTSVGGGTNPEELFACGYAACFNGALRLCAEKNGIQIGDSTVWTSVSLNKESNDKTAGVPMRLGLGVSIEVEVAGVDTATAQRLAKLAHEFCPYSRAIRGNVPVEILGVAKSSPAEAAATEPPSESLRVLVVGRRKDVMGAMLGDCRNMGLDAHGAVNNAEAEALLREHSFNACAVGFRYGNLEGQDIEGLRAMLRAKGVPHVDMPPGSKNVRNALQRLGLDAPRGEAYNVGV